MMWIIIDGTGGAQGPGSRSRIIDDVDIVYKGCPDGPAAAITDRDSLIGELHRLCLPWHRGTLARPWGA